MSKFLDRYKAKQGQVFFGKHVFAKAKRRFCQKGLTSLVSFAPFFFVLCNLHSCKKSRFTGGSAWLFVLSASVAIHGNAKSLILCTTDLSSVCALISLTLSSAFGTPFSRQRANERKSGSGKAATALLLEWRNKLKVQDLVLSSCGQSQNCIFKATSGV